MSEHVDPLTADIDVTIKAEVHLRDGARFEVDAPPGWFARPTRLRVNYLTYEPGSNRAHLWGERVYADGVRTEKNGRPIGHRPLDTLPGELATMLRGIRVIPSGGESALLSEAQWLETAHANSADKGYSVEYRRGFAAAAGWVRFHAENLQRGGEEDET